MAKKDAPEDGNESYDFVPPDFDEDAFIHNEMVAYRATIVTILLALLASLVSLAGFWAVHGQSVGWPLGLAVFLVAALATKWVLRKSKVDVAPYTRGKWFGTYFMLFVTWLAFFIVLVNPPVGDFAAPQVNLAASPAIQQAGGNVTIDLVSSDNAALASHDFQLTDAAGKVVADESALVSVGEQGERVSRLQLVAHDLAPGTYHATATAVDARGHRTTGTTDIVVGPKVLEFFGGDLTSIQNNVAVAVNGLAACDTGTIGKVACVRTVYLVGTGPSGATTNVTLKHNPDKHLWEAYQTTEGWNNGLNSVMVVAEQGDQFFGSERLHAAPLTLKGPFHVNVTKPTSDLIHVDVLANPAQPVRNVPGVGVAAVAVGLLALAFVARRRK